MHNQPLPLHFENKQLKIYGTLLERVGATLLDIVILVPMGFLIMYINSQNLYNFYYSSILSTIIVAAYTIYLPVRYGATPGKRIVGLTILKLDGSEITYREAFLKYIPTLLTTLFSFAIQTVAISNADPNVYNNLPWTQQAKYLESVNTFLQWVNLSIMYDFSLCNLFIVWFNSRNRSTGDFIAGTIVVKTAALSKIKEYREKDGED